MRDYEDVYLIQRLLKPRTPTQPPSGPFTFGGGGGRLSKEALELLKGIWVFDYMGAAEFEFGSVPAALNELAHTKLMAFELGVPYSKIEKPWVPKTEKLEVQKGKFTFYVICPDGHQESVSKAIQSVAKGKHQLKERTCIVNAVFPRKDSSRDACGWLALDPPFMFFSDKEMFEKTKSLFVDRKE